jgi:hypothetical protein
MCRAKEHPDKRSLLEERHLGEILQLSRGKLRILIYFSLQERQSSALFNKKNIEDISSLNTDRL